MRVQLDRHPHGRVICMLLNCSVGRVTLVRSGGEEIMDDGSKRRRALPVLIACGILILVTCVLVLLLSAFGVLRFWQSERQPQGATDLTFSKADLPFVHEADLETSLPFLASAAVDINGDGTDELFLGGGNGQADQLFAFRDGGFVATDISFSKDGSDATHGAAAIDIDNDGDTDIFAARESGVWFHENQGGTFGSEQLALSIADNTTPLSIAFADLNQDGLADMYIAGYLKIELVEGETIFSDGYGGYSHLFLNAGDGDWVDISEQAGVFRQHNTFTALFADLDNDADSDLIVAQDTGKVEMYQNNGDLTFTPIANPSDYSYPMGVAAGDYDSDGLIDLYFSNVGYTLPPALLRGDLDNDDVFNPAYMLFHNQGDLRFEDTAADMNAARYGFGWGVVFADLNLDGREDLLAAQNYARFPGNDLLVHYPGKILQNYGDKFQPVEKVAGAENSLFGIAPIVSDFNGDGWPDLLVGHVYEPDSKLWLNNGGNGFLRVTQFGHDTVRTTHNSTFADIDNDGDLDMFSHNWDFMRTAEEIHVWKNDGRGLFEPWQDDVVYGAFGDRDYTFAANFADVNKDGNLDILVAADFQRSQVFQGTESGEYINATRASDIKDYNAMGAAIGDIDNDQDLDWFVTNIQFPIPGYAPFVNRMYRNESPVGGDIQMDEVAAYVGVEDGLWAWGACMKDFDNDGWLDIFHVNGFGYANNTFEHPLFDVLSWLGITGVYDLIDSNVVGLINSLYEYFGGFAEVNERLGNGYLSEGQLIAELEALIQSSKELNERLGQDTFALQYFYGTPARLFMNNQNGTFREEAELRHIDDTGEGRGIVCNDFDRDGDIDIVIMNHNGLPSYYENHFRRILNAEDNFLNVRLQGVGGNQHAYGAKVYATSDTLNQYREMRFENNYMSNNAPELHFGLAADDVVSELRVEWPDGEVTVLNDVPVNQFMVIEHPSYND